MKREFILEWFFLASLLNGTNNCRVDTPLSRRYCCYCRAKQVNAPTNTYRLVHIAQQNWLIRKSRKRPQPSSVGGGSLTVTTIDFRRGVDRANRTLFSEYNCLSLNDKTINSMSIETTPPATEWYQPNSRSVCLWPIACVWSRHTASYWLRACNLKRSTWHGQQQAVRTFPNMVTGCCSILYQWNWTLLAAASSVECNCSRYLGIQFCSRYSAVGHPSVISATSQCANTKERWWSHAPTSSAHTQIFTSVSYLYMEGCFDSAATTRSWPYTI